MKKFLAVTASAALALMISAPSFAAGAKKGFDTTVTQGSGGKTNTNANPDNSGTTTVSGPKGQLQNGKTANTTVDLPGNGR